VSQRRSITAAVLVLLLITSTACSKKSDQQPMDPASQSIGKVRLYVDGRITLDGAPVSLDELKRAFGELKAKNGVVWYFREAGQANPPAGAMEVMAAVVDAKSLLLIKWPRPVFFCRAPMVI
jgi:hypothetical protein